MHSTTISAMARVMVIGAGILLPLSGAGLAGGQQVASAGATRTLNLADALTAGQLRAMDVDVTPLAERPGAVHAEPRAGGGGGMVWVEGIDFAEGTIEIEARGRDVYQQSFLGLAFNGTETTFECVYLRPFNFRATDPSRHQHAVQYMAVPGYEWPRLRQDFPEEFENPVDASAEPEGWVPLRLVVTATRVQIFVGTARAPALEVRRLAAGKRGMIGLWGIGDFANLRITPAT